MLPVRRPSFNTRGLSLLGLFLAGVLHAEVCWVCGKDPLEMFVMADKVTGDKRYICPDCSKLKTWCYLCGLPAKDKITQLQDGRVLCFRDAKDAVLDEQEAKRICADAKNELARLFSRFITFPETNVTIEIVDRVRMQQLMQTPGFERQCPSIFGYVRSRVAKGGGWRHPISLLSGLPKYRLMAVCAHEIAHTWARENVPARREMERATEEGFCELIAYRLMESLNQETEKKVIEENNYTLGQFNLFREADNTYGFYTIMQWMKWGSDQRLLEEEPDRIRKIDEKTPSPASTVFNTTPLLTGPTPVPDELTLIGILGVGRNRLALINDRSLASGESGKVRFAETNAIVHCLEVRSDSVLIQVEGSAEKRELFLRSKQSASH